VIPVGWLTSAVLLKDCAFAATVIGRNPVYSVLFWDRLLVIPRGSRRRNIAFDSDDGRNRTTTINVMACRASRLDARPGSMLSRLNELALEFGFSLDSQVLFGRMANDWS